MALTSTFARRAGLILGATGMYVGVSGMVFLYMTAGKEDADDTGTQLQKHPSKSFVTNPHRAEKFDDLAARYDFLINNDERFMGMNLFRRFLIKWHAKGTVLEMAAGTGRNCSFYATPQVSRVILTDTSQPMLDQAKQKIAELSPSSKPQFAMIQINSQQLDFPDNSFDTVVDTFGLCSFDDPIAALNEMSRVCKPDGKILLLEHGRSKNWSTITEYLDKNVERHARNWGCVFNRDLDHIVEEAGLQVDTKFTWHFGTTYYMVCRPDKKSQQLSSNGPSISKGQ